MPFHILSSHCKATQKYHRKTGARAKEVKKTHTSPIPEQEEETPMYLVHHLGCMKTFQSDHYHQETG